MPSNLLPGGESPDYVHLWVKGENVPQTWQRHNVTHDETGVYLRSRVVRNPDVYSTVFYPWASIESVAWYEL